MTVCKFFLEGRCNFGSSCRNEHPVDAQQRNNHRFGATDSNNPLRGRIGFPSSSSDYPATRIYDDRSVRSDLSKDRPEYKYSCYGPAKEEPNLLEGTDFSPEELRVQYYNIMSTNGVDTAYRAGVKDLDERMQSRIDSILRDVRSTLTQFDAKRQQLAQQQASSGFAFGQPPQPQPQPVPQQQETYGTPSVLGAPAPSATPSPFGSSINQPNQPNQPNTPLLGSTYNQPTAPTPLFGANPSGFGSSNYSGSLSNYPVAQAQPNAGSIFGYQPPQQPDPQQQYLLQMQQQQQQQELYAQQQQQQQQQQQMLMMQQMQQQPPQPGNTQGTINNPQMQAFASSQFELYKIPEIPPPSDFRR